MAFPIDKRGRGEYHEVVKQMESGSTKDQELLKALHDVTCLNTQTCEEMECDNDDNENVEETANHNQSQSLEHDKSQSLEHDKSQSLELESQAESHTETDSYGDSDLDAHKRDGHVTNEQEQQRDGCAINEQDQQHDGCAINEQEQQCDRCVINKDRDGLLINEHDGMGTGTTNDNLIIIQP